MQTDGGFSISELRKPEILQNLLLPVTHARHFSHPPDR
jgi:hypothetical protein